jgi:hypothetical protein
MGSRFPTLPSPIQRRRLPQRTGRRGDRRARETPPWPKLEFPSNIDEAAPVLDILRDAGLGRARLALAPDAEIAQQHPFSPAASAIVAGFILVRILKERNMTLE